MNRVIHLAKTVLPLLVIIVLACFCVSPPAHAVSPAPDGCYPNYTTAEGCGALNLLTNGFGNTGLGWYALFSDSSGSYNTGIGGGALALNNADSNTAVGAAALLLNTTGTLNTAIGTDALVYNDSGAADNAVGAFALFNNTTGTFNNAHGRDALGANVDGIENEAFGDEALISSQHDSHNTAVGDNALLTQNGGDENTAVGRDAGDNIVDGSNNVAIGGEAGTGIVHASNVIAINVPGVSSAFGDASDTCYIGNIFGQPVGVGPGQAVYVDSDGVLGFTISSKRFKHDIKPMDKASEMLYALKPVTFKYNKDKSGMTCFGLIAEDVAEVNPDLVLRDKQGEVSSVRYEQINAMLLNEFLKEHKKVEEQQVSIAELKSTVAQQQKGMDVLTAQLKEQAAQIQKVSAQLEVSGSAPRTVLNDP
jgi:hypothetical protein